MRRAAFLLITAIALALMASSARAMILITADRGGLITDYAERFLSARATGEQVVIDGACLSACTLVVGMLPRDKICATPKAVLGFHAAWLSTRRGRMGAPAATDYMAQWYPPAAKDWIARHGGLKPGLMYLRGPELYAIVPACEAHET